MKIRLTRLFLINKRLFRSRSFLILLLLIPFAAAALHFVSTGEKGVVTIATAVRSDSVPSSQGTAAAPEKSENRGAYNVIDRLKKQTTIIRFLDAPDPESAIEAAARGQADAAWIFTEDYDANLSNIAAGGSRVLVEVYAQEDTVFTRLAREKLFAAVYPDLSRQIFRQFIAETTGDIPEKDFETYYNMQAAEGSLVRFALADSSTSGEDALRNDYLLLPVRGLLSILIFAAAMAAAIFYAQDDRNGCFTWLPSKERHGMLLSYIGSAVLWTALCSLAALYVTGVAGSLPHELLLMLLYGIAVTALCSILRRILRKAEYLAIFLPVAILLVLGLCPVFLNFRTLPLLSNLLPSYHYLHGVNSVIYTRRLALAALLYAAADGAAALVPLLRRK